MRRRLLFDEPHDIGARCLNAGHAVLHDLRTSRRIAPRCRGATANTGPNASTRDIEALPGQAHEELLQARPGHLQAGERHPVEHVRHEQTRRDVTASAGPLIVRW